jgi:integrase
MTDRLSLPFEEWPELHKTMWLDKIEYSHKLDDWPTANWRPRTRLQARQSYGRWLKWNEDEGLLDGSTTPVDLIVSDLVKKFVKEEMARIKITSVRNIVCHLMGIAKSAAPDRDWSWLLEILVDLDNRARREPQATPQIAPAQDLYALRLGLTQDARKRETEGPIDAERYLDGLLIAVLIAEPQRVSAFAALELGSHIRRGPTGWYVNVDAAMTKTEQTERGALPPSLTAAIDYYVDHLRPQFVRSLASPNSKKFWIGPDGKPLSANQIRGRIKSRSQQAFGFPICPHTFRHIALTTLMWDAPQCADCGPALLGDSAAIAETHYLVPQPARALKFLHDLLEGQSASCNVSARPSVQTHITTPDWRKS